MRKYYLAQGSTWTNTSDIDHIGPAAQDFYRLFEVGTDDKGISAVDPAGIALAAIQQLIKENNDLKQRIERLEAILHSKN